MSDLKKKSSTKKTSVKGKLAGKLKRAVRNSQNEVQTLSSAACKYKQIKEEEEKPKLAKEDDFKQFAIDPVILRNLKYEGASAINMGNKENQRTVTCFIKTPIPKDKRMRPVLVMKPADPDSAIVKPLDNVTNYAGPRFTNDGLVIEHSILGNYDDFRNEAKCRGEFMHLFEEGDTGDPGRTCPSVAPEECPALQKWQVRLQEWNQQQRRLSIKVHRPVGDLLMRTQNYYPEWAELRQEVGVAAETVQSGYGRYRVMTHCWKEPILIGHKDDSPLIATYGQSVYGDQGMKEFRGIPSHIKKELGMDMAGRSYKPYYTDYMTEARSRGDIRDAIHILNPHHPDLSDLMVKGDGQFKVRSKERPKRNHFQGHIIIHSPCLEDDASESVYRSGIRGPALLVGNQLLTWEEPRDSPYSKAFITEPVLSPVSRSGGDSPVQPLSLIFTTKPKERRIEKIFLRNCGSTLIRYDWVKVPIISPFGLYKERRQHFYFLSENGTLPPGGCLDLPVLYKSDHCGLFKETWKLKTQPVLCGGADILIHFRARTIGPAFSEEIGQIQRRVEDKANTVTMRKILEDLAYCVEETDKTLISPLYISTEQEFNKCHTGMFYKKSRMQKMEKLYNSISNSKLVPKSQDTFSVDNTLKIMCKLDCIEMPSPDNPDYEEIVTEREEKKEKFIDEYFSVLKEFSFRPFLPCDCYMIKRINISTQIFMKMVEDFSESACKMADSMGISVKPLEPEQDEKADKKKKRGAQRGRKTGDVKNNTPGKVLGSVASKCQKKGSQSPQTDVPGSIHTVVSPGKIESFSPVAQDKASAVQQELYREKLHLQMYSLLHDALDIMDTVFSTHNDTSFPL